MWEWLNIDYVLFHALDEVSFDRCLKTHTCSVTGPLLFLRRAFTSATDRFSVDVPLMLINPAPSCKFSCHSDLIISKAREKLTSSMFFSFYLKESRLCCRRGRVQVGDVNCCVSLCVSLSELHRITLMLGHNQSNLTVSVDYTVTKATCPVTVLYGS